MGKTEVYSWRVSPAVKAELEHEARREGASLATLLDRIAAEWLEARRRDGRGDTREQARLHATAARLLGTISGGDARRAARARALIRARLARRRAR